MIPTAPPAIPACRKGEPWEAREHLIMWVHTGRAHVRVANGDEHRVDAGTGIWLPPGDDHDMWTEPGSVAVPTWIAPHAVPDAPTEVTRFTVAPGSRDWLIAQFAYAVTRSTPSVGRQVSPGSLVRLLEPSRPLVPGNGGDAEPGRYPPMPRSAAARKVARELVRNPSLDQTVEEWAARASCSPNTLRRDFRRQTDLTFARWRTLTRLAAACEFLAAGYDVGQVAARTGFASRSGLTRAFREQHGITPREYAAQLWAATDGHPARRVLAERQAGALAHLFDAVPAPPQTLLATRTVPTTSPYHELTWVYRGEGWARVGDTVHPMTRGDTIWLPAGRERETELPEGSLALPVSVLDADDLQLTAPLRARFPASWDTYLLYCAVSTNTLMRPEGYDPRHLLDVFGDQLAVERSRTVPMPRSPRAREAATDFLRQLGMGTAGLTYDVPADVHQAFRADTGMPFASWRHAARMRIARDLLAAGAKPGVVARRVGYTQVSNFSRAFSRFHGMSPREHQGRELDQP